MEWKSSADALLFPERKKNAVQIVRKVCAVPLDGVISDSLDPYVRMFPCKTVACNCSKCD